MRYLYKALLEMSAENVTHSHRHTELGAQAPYEPISLYMILHEVFYFSWTIFWFQGFLEDPFHHITSYIYSTLVLVELVISFFTDQPPFFSKIVSDSVSTISFLKMHQSFV